MWSEDIDGLSLPRQERPPRVIWLLYVYLAAITIFGKGPTYLGFNLMSDSLPPLYWGEITMLLVLTWMLLREHVLRLPARVFASPGVIILFFMVLGLVLALLGYRRWGVDALRDAAVWYYGTFFFIGVYITFFPEYADWLWKRFVWIWLAALVWNLFQYLIGWPDALNPVIPDRDVRLFSGSGSENIMHMSLGAVLLAMGYPQTRKIRPAFVVILVCTVVFMLFLFQARGVRVAILAAIIIGWFASKGIRRYALNQGKSVAIIALLLWTLVFAAVVSSMRDVFQAGKLERFHEVSLSNPQGTAYWRMVWWENIVDAVHHRDPLFGLGFGINLGAFNPFLERDADSPWPVRSPHSYNMTVFGRMGYVGLTLWAAILVVGLGQLFLRARRGGIGGRYYTFDRRKELIFWLMMLTATWVNASFGVLMEGPVLGIWFWFALGFATGRSIAPDGLEPLRSEEYDSPDENPINP